MVVRNTPLLHRLRCLFYIIIVDRRVRAAAWYSTAPPWVACSPHVGALNVNTHIVTC